MSASTRLTAKDIRVAMAARWAEPEYAIMWEVGEGTGAVRGRYADAVIMSLWPSRGLELHGVEIKISRPDWKREAADPTKAEAIAKFCDRWWIHTLPGVVQDVSELPPAWGLREFDGRVWRTVREADKTEAEAVTRPFLAAMLRRADGAMRALMDESLRASREAIDAERVKLRDDFANEVNKVVARRTGELDEVRRNLAAFETAFGIPIERWQDYSRIGAAAKTLVACGEGGWGDLAERLRKAANEIDAITALSRPASPQSEKEAA